MQILCGGERLNQRKGRGWGVHAVKFYCKEVGGGGELSLSELKRLTSAKHLQRNGNPLLGRACTSE